jgi:carbamoylphosphate synthase large subunit
MATSDDDGYAREVVKVVRDLTTQFEEHTRNGDEGRKQLLRTVEGIVAGLRTDVHKAIISLQLNNSDHEKAHTADRIERATRQVQVDAQMVELRHWLIGLTVGVVGILFFLVGWLVF